MSNSAISFNTAGLASTTSPGLVGTGAQTFAGDKTFNGLVSANGGAITTGLTGANATTVTTSGSGKVGEKLSATLSNVTLAASGVSKTVGTLTLSRGIWMVFATFAVGNPTGTSPTVSYVQLSISTTTDTQYLNGIVRDKSTQLIGSHLNVQRHLIVPTDNYNVYAVIYSEYTGTATQTFGNFCDFFAIRLA